MALKYALITGASSGIGEVFARELARSGHSCILVARSVDKLESLGAELRSSYPSAEIVVIPRDLSEPNAAATLFAETQAREVEVDLLINNAGFGAFGDFEELPLDRQIEMLRLNVSALVELTHFYLRPMRAQRAGAVVNVASTAAFFPGAYFATYAATKAFVLSFSQALFVENRKHGVLVVALCPGATETNFFEVAKMPTFAHRLRLQTPQKVVYEAMRGLRNRRPVTVSGVTNKVMAIASRIIPRVIMLELLGAMFEKMYHQKNERRG